jgi:CheY-like chemotaxis protein
MNKKGQIIVIEDDTDDQELLAEVFKELNYSNEIVFFQNGEEALEYLQDEKIYPFLILADINMPKLNGFELRKMVHTNEGLSQKCIPYLFFSTAVDKSAVYEAYAMSVQGYFVKTNSYAQVLNTMRKIVEYWQECYSPNYFED